MLSTIIKRDGTEVPFDQSKITIAISKALKQTGKNCEDAASLSDQVANRISDDKARDNYLLVTVEYVQDIVQEILMNNHFYKTAQSYILYREKHRQMRKKSARTPPTLSKTKYFDDPYQEFIFLRTYSNWDEELHRREDWYTAVSRRFRKFMMETDRNQVLVTMYDKIIDFILYHKVMPSMRNLQFAGKAAHRNNLCIYNCCYVAPCELIDLRDIMYVLMCGTGVGFSVERKYISKFPLIGQKNTPTMYEHIVEDSKEGWCDAFYFGLKTWYNGDKVTFDYSKVRPAGARLYTTGGRASGPEPLKDLMTFTEEKILSNAGNKLTTLDVHDIICYIGRIVQVGGVRRSALISLSDLNDNELRDCKSGNFWLTNSQRYGANNSATYQKKPDDINLLNEWTALINSCSGERGIFNRSNLHKCLPERRVKLLGDRIMDLGTNPCGEIYLQSHQLCNLTSVICRADDTLETLLEKVEIATIIGTWQSTLTNFTYVSQKFRDRCEEERLLGVSLTGMQDCAVLWDANVLQQLKERAIEVNRKYAELFGVNESTCVTCVKPEGTNSELNGTSSGIHPRHSKYYIRRVRISSTDPLFAFMRDRGVPYHPDVGENPKNPSKYVLEFPIKSPDGSRERNTALEMLEDWKLVKVNFTEHNPSTTIYVGKDEWIPVLNWVNENWDCVGGLSFFPKSDHVYALAPFEAIDEKTYEELKSQMPSLDYSKLIHYESDDNTDMKHEMACAGGQCFL